MSKKKEKEIKKNCNCPSDCDYECNDGLECQCNEHNDKDGCTNCNCDECHTDNKEVEALQNYIKELEEKVLREKAELINYRRRKDDEISSMLKYSDEDMIKELLPIVDNFERAIKLDNNDLSDELSKFLEGFKMIYTSIINILNKYEVKAIDGSSKPFDPSYHQAVLTEKIDGVESGIVIEVLQKGYLYKDRVLRPAMVKVSE